jgi:asparagine synthase (glutamine-hydrolysing)
MCGITGILRWRGNGGNDAEIVSRMTDALAHRGPDDKGVVTIGPCTLGNRRLSVIDTSLAGHQPMGLDWSNCWITYNGEVYNFRDLRRRHELDREAAPFVSKCDTEVILRAYEKLGLRVINELNGMFGLAIWDDRAKSLLLARDPFGTKPLFYYQDADVLCFASEIKALLAYPKIQRRVNLAAVHDFLSLNYIPGEQTAFEEIHELRPGHVLLAGVSPDSLSIRQYFNWDYPADSVQSVDEAAASLRLQLEDSVARHLISDVPVGIMLSGGLDSSALAAMVRKIRNDGDFHTFSIGFDEPTFDESPYAAIVSKHLGTRHHQISVTAEKACESAQTAIAYIDEPYADGSAIPTLILAAEAKAEVTVLLSGEGGDELFAGYDTHAAWRVRHLYRRTVPGFIRRRLVRPFVNRLPVSYEKLSLEFRAKRFVEGAELDVADAHFFWRHVLNDDAKSELLRSNAATDGIGMPTPRHFRKAFAASSARDELNRLLFVDTQFHLPDDLMVKNDRMTMAHSIESRVPFTDLELFRYVAGLPVAMKMAGLTKKYLLREALRPYLPAVILHKKKVGLEMPYSHWFRTCWREFAGDILSRDRIAGTSLLDADVVSRYLSEHWNRRADHGRILWGLLNLMIWHDLYISSRRYSEYHAAVRRPRQRP